MTKNSPRRRFDGKVALITGGNAGIGFAAATAFAGEGARVMIAARRRQEGEQAVAAITAAGGEARFVETDVASADSVRAMVGACVEAYGRLDIAFNNAGITGDVTTLVADADEERFDQVMEINVKGVWLSMKYEIPELLKAGGGAIINCSSVAGLRGGPRSGAYYGSKHAVIGMTKTAALEYATHNIRINAVCPGLIMTDLIATGFAAAPEKLASLTARIPMQRSGQPHEIADAVLWLASSESSFVSGVALPVDGALSAT
ncbi:glucose 1-dehydrogenase [Massilia cavernae]|uniref:Glucose 1-dehydrogenase n=1 Tax=Massilia cavernae TaxID=2320864 RepID=A0A418X7A0_9BURK|nr:glucose 1-dehydrogenase [Massilia cavernae]RJG08278.1 glucose 1-dehydrogenase [Massilia cavernae]